MTKQQRDMIARAAARAIMGEFTEKIIAKRIRDCLCDRFDGMDLTPDDILTVKWEVKFRQLKNGREELIK